MPKRPTRIPKGAQVCEGEATLMVVPTFKCADQLRRARKSEGDSKLVSYYREGTLTLSKEMSPYSTILFHHLERNFRAAAQRRFGPLHLKISKNRWLLINC